MSQQEQTPADIIWSQIPRSTKMAVGARLPMKSDGGLTLTFTVTITRGKCHKITVTYDRGQDAYNIKLFYIRGGTCRVEEQCEGVYAEDLGRIIYDYCLEK